jgi:hypothetical protein
MQGKNEQVSSFLAAYPGHAVYPRMLPSADPFPAAARPAALAFSGVWVTLWSGM